MKFRFQFLGLIKREHKLFNAQKTGKLIFREETGCPFSAIEEISRYRLSPLYLYSIQLNV